MDTIFVRAIEFYGYHGASDEEQVVGHRYLVDVDLRYCTRRAGNSDKLQDTINYSRVAKRIVEIGWGALPSFRGACFPTCGSSTC